MATPDRPAGPPTPPSSANRPGCAAAGPPGDRIRPFADLESLPASPSFGAEWAGKTAGVERDYRVTLSPTALRLERDPEHYLIVESVPSFVSAAGHPERSMLRLRGPQVGEFAQRGLAHTAIAADPDHGVVALVPERDLPRRLGADSSLGAHLDLFFRLQNRPRLVDRPAPAAPEPVRQPLEAPKQASVDPDDWFSQPRSSFTGLGHRPRT